MTCDPPGRRRLVLLSGGLDSAALAAWTRPEGALFIDYGQRPARAEAAASRAVAGELGIPFDAVRVDASAVGSGLLSSDADADADAGYADPGRARPSPEWWPFRNQFLVTVAAAWAVGRAAPPSLDGWQVELGTVRSDGTRHADGTAAFYSALDALMSVQEGGVAVRAPALAMSSEELIDASAAADAVLGWTHSCHRADLPCHDCPGCHKREAVLDGLGRLR